MSNASDARDEMHSQQARGVTCSKILALLWAIGHWIYGDKKKEKKDGPS